MKVVLTAINAKYIHSNLGIYSLRAYGEKMMREKGIGGTEIELAEYTINQTREQVLSDLYRRKPDIIGFSCYIWNISFVRELLADLSAILPDVRIWLGGPETAGRGEEFLKYPGVDLIMTGEGERTFASLLENPKPENWEQIPGIVYQKDGRLQTNPPVSVMDMSQIPFPYRSVDPKDLEHRIIYYESSRGCPFSCAYCLSSLDKQIRFRDLSLVYEELEWFLHAKVPQVKFVVRTFNCKKSHAIAIWSYILEHDNGTTNFHFEIAADLLDEEQLQLLSGMRPGLIQLEIGVQSVNPQTLQTIRRKTDIRQIAESVARINSWHNIHQQLDLIAGLPWEDLQSFRRSFNQVYAMEPEQLQLGFLKLLKGSYMEELAPSCGIVCSAAPPYEVLKTKWLSYGDLLELKQVEEMTEVYYNSRQFTQTIRRLETEYDSPYAMFSDLADFYERRGYQEISHSRMARYEIFWEFVEEKGLQKEEYRDLLMCDLYLRENLKSRPSFARELSPYKDAIRSFFQKEEAHPEYLTGYEGLTSRQMEKMAHLEPMGDGKMVLFDYKQRDPLSHNARCVVLAEV